MLLSLQVSEAGVHRPHVGGIHGRSNDGSYSLVLAGGFEDEVVGCLYFVCVDASFFYQFTFYDMVTLISVICGRTGEMSSPTQAAGVVTSQETSESESTLLTRP